MKNLQYFVCLFIISLCFFESYCSSRISDKRLCADPKCSVAVSLARAVLRYQSDDDRILSFSPGETVTIYSKSAGSKADLWGAQIGKKRGYVPKNLVQEYRILKKELKYTVTTDDDALRQEQAKLENEQADKDPYYDIVDGTTLYIPEDSTMQMTTNPDPKPVTSPVSQKEPVVTSGAPTDKAPATGHTAPEEIPLTHVHSQVLTKNKQVDTVQSESISGAADEFSERGGIISPSDTPADVPPVEIPVSDVPPVEIPVSDVPPAEAPLSGVSPAEAPLSGVPPAEAPLSDVPPAEIPVMSIPSEVLTENQKSSDDEVSKSVDQSVPPAEKTVSDDPPAQIPVISEVLTDNKESPDKSVEDSSTPTDASEASSESSLDPEASSVYDYFADTLTGWMSGDGGSAEDDDEEEDEEENEDTEPSSGQQPEKVPASTEVPGVQQSDVTPIPTEESQKYQNTNPEVPEISVPEVVSKQTEVPEEQKIEIEVPQSVQDESSKSEVHVNHSVPLEQPDIPQINTQDSLSNIDISKINYLSTNPNIVPQSDQPPADDQQQTDDFGVQEKITIPDSEFQILSEFAGTDTVPPATPYYSSSETVSSETSQSEEKTEHILSENVTPSGVEEPSAPFTYSWDLPSDSVEESTPSPTFYEPSQEQTTASGTFEEEITTPSPSEEVTTESAETTASSSEETTFSSATFEENTTVSPDTQPAESTAPGMFEEVTTSDGAARAVFEEITPSIQAETGSAGTFEEITTPSPSEPPVAEEGESGAIFASWIYTLLGYGETEASTEGPSIPEVTTTSAPHISETTSAAPISTPSEERSESPTLEQADSESSWWPWSSKEDTKLDETASQQTSCSAGGDCDEVGAAPSLLPQQIVTSTPPHQQLWTAETVKMDLESVLTSGTFIYLVVTAVTVLIFTLGYYYIENIKKDGTHIAIINSLQKQLLVASKEKLILQDELDVTKDEVSQVQTSSSCSSEEVEQLKYKLEESERVRSEAEDQVASLEKELEAATEAGLELNNMLSEFLSAQKGSEDLSMGVELLQQQLNKQQTTISTMNQTLSSKTLEIESLQQELAESRDQLQELQSQREKTSELLQEVQQQKHKLKEDLEESCVTLANQLQEAAQQRETEVSVLRDQLKASELRLSEIQDSLRARSCEVEVLEKSLSQLKQLSDDGETKEGDKKLDALLNVGKAQAELKLVTSERDVLKERLQGEEDARQLLEDHVTVIREQVEKLKERHELAEKEKLEAQTKLEVLSSYFKEKETQLQKELGLQEAMSEQKKEHVSSTHVKIKCLEEEIANFKTQTETLKQEIIDQERSLKSQITTLEKKAHENWIAARQAERKLDDSKQEAGTLRNRLTLLEKGGVTVAQNGEDGKTAQRTLDSNGELLLPTSPLLHIGDSPSMSPPHPHFMMMPPPPVPPGQFMPPPPPPEYMHSPPPPLPLYPDRRPPPLGRMSSPPPHHFSPPPPDRYSSPYRPRSPASDRSLPRYRYSSRSPSPPPYDYGHYPPAPRPWDESRSGFRPLNRDKDTKGSTLSSGHSSESLGKSSRHSKS